MLGSEVREVDFREALACTEGHTRHLLLGNGFSIAARRSFHYDRLYDVAVGLDPSLAHLFEQLGTTNFEVALRGLSEQVDLQDLSQAEVAEDRAREIKRGLISAVTEVHPDSSQSLTVDEYQSCRAFLAHFIGPKRWPRRGKAFTTNYDLLLYWTAVRYARELKAEDGWLYGEWKPERLHAASILFLHGGLHIFDNRAVIEKLKYGEQRLVEQIQERLQRDQFPVFVTEATSAEKAQRIRRSAYLRPVWKTFERACKAPGAVLFTMGHSLGDEDEHITNCIGLGQLTAVYAGAFGGLASPDGQRVRELVSTWSVRRAEHGMAPLQGVYVFNSLQCGAWGTD